MILIAGARCCFCSLWPPSRLDKQTASHESNRQTQAHDQYVWGHNTACIKYTAALPVSLLESRRQCTGKQGTKQPPGARTLKARLLRKLSNVRVRKQSKARLRQPAHNNKGPSEIYTHREG